MPHLLDAGDAALAIQYPNRGLRPGQAAASPSLADLADLAAADLVRHASGVLIIVGHSMGALIGYELTKRLQAEGREVRLLVISAARPPESVDFRADTIAAMGAQDWESELRAQGMLDAETLALPGFLDRIVPTLSADYLLLASYRDSGGTVTCPLYAICGAADPHATPAELARWGDRTTSRFRLSVFPGGHFYYQTQLESVCQSILGQAGPGRQAATDEKDVRCRTRS